MEWSKKRKIIYGISISLALVILASLLTYFLLYKAPSCSDNKQNGNETGVDCGGECARFCAPDVKELNVVWAKAFSLTAGRYSVAAYVENPNTNAGIKNVRYTVRVFDDSGKLLLNKDEVRDEIAPGSAFLLFEGNFDFATAPTSVEVDWNKDDMARWEKASLAKSSILMTKNETLTKTDTKPRFDATLLNTDLVNDTGRVLLGAIIYDSARNPIAVSTTYVDNVPKGGEQDIFFTWPSRFTTRDKGGLCITPVDTMLVFDRSGSMAQALSSAKKAANAYIDASQPADKIGLVSFADTASNPVDLELSIDHNTAKNAVGNISIQKDSLQYTNLGDALKQALGELSIRAGKNAKHVIVALTDGVSNRPIDPKNPSNTNYGNEYANTEADAVKAAKGEIYVIGLGSGVNKSFLRDHIATNASHYFSAPTASDLQGVYKKISESVCKDENFITEIVITPKAIFTN